MGSLETDVGTNIEQTQYTCDALRAAGLESLCQPILLPPRDPTPQPGTPSTSSSSGLGIHDQILLPRDGRLQPMTLEPANSLKVGMLTPQSLNTKDFANLLQENFEKIDTDKDGILGQTELKTFSAKGSEDLRSREAARVAAYHTEALGTLAVDSNKQFASKIGTDLSRGINTFDKLFLEKGDVADNQGITAKDLQVLKLLHESDKFESEVHKARKSEKIWGGVATIGGIVAVGVLGYLSFRTNSARTGINYALGGAQALNVVVAGAKSWANSRVEPALRQEYTARQEMLQSWNYFSR